MLLLTTVVKSKGLELHTSNFLIQEFEGASTSVLNLCKHTEPLRRFPGFCGTPFLPNITESKTGYMFKMAFVEPLKNPF